MHTTQTMLSLNTNGHIYNANNAYRIYRHSADHLLQMKYTTEFCRSMPGNESDTNLMPSAVRSNYLTDIEFCKFVLHRMFGYNINLRTASARVKCIHRFIVRANIYPCRNQKNNIRDQHLGTSVYSRARHSFIPP